MKIISQWKQSLIGYTLSSFNYHKTNFMTKFAHQYSNISKSLNSMRAASRRTTHSAEKNNTKKKYDGGRRRRIEGIVLWDEKISIQLSIGVLPDKYNAHWNWYEAHEKTCWEIKKNLTFYSTYFHRSYRHTSITIIFSYQHTGIELFIDSWVIKKSL